MFNSGAEMGVLKHVIGHAVEIVAVASETVKAVGVRAHLVAVVHAVIIVPVHAQIHVPVPAQGHVLMTVKVLALVIVRSCNTGCSNCNGCSSCGGCNGSCSIGCYTACNSSAYV